jgi:hypothetical protein
MIMAIWDDQPSSPPQIQTPVRGGSRNTLILIGAIGCLLTVVGFGADAFLMLYPYWGPILFYLSYVVRYLIVGGLVFMGIGFWGFYQRYDSALSLIGTFGFIVAAGIRAIPAGIIYQFLESITPSEHLLFSVWRFLLSGPLFIGALCGAAAVFSFRNETADWRFALVAALGLLAFAVIPFVESILYAAYPALISMLPVMFVNMVVVSMVHAPTAAGSFLSMLYMWNDRFDH